MRVFVTVLEIGRNDVRIGMDSPPRHVHVQRTVLPGRDLESSGNTTCPRDATEEAVYFFFTSRCSGVSASVKTTISSPVTVLISWCKLRGLMPVIS